MNTPFKAVCAAALLSLGTQVCAQIVFYENEGFRGRTFSTQSQVNNFERFGFNDRASSVMVTGEYWEVCDDVRFGGRCVVLSPGQYPSLASMGLNDRVSSTRVMRPEARIDDDGYAPEPAPVYDSRRRDNERLFEAPVTSVRAVVGPPGQRCWLEREQVAQAQGNANGNSNVPAAIAGALIGGILGHQVGDGRGKDLATVGGAIAGGAAGSTFGRDGRTQAPATQDVQRCASVPGQVRPDLWDVSYEFRGQQHQVQMVQPPGPTVTVNRRGEPRE